MAGRDGELARPDCHEVGAERGLDVDVADLVEDLEVQILPEIFDVLGLRCREPVILGLGCVRAGHDGPEVNDGADPERPAVLAQERSCDEVSLRRDRADVLESIRVDSRDADPRPACHSCDVVDDDLHSSEVDDLEVAPFLGQELDHEPAVPVLRAGLATQQRGPRLEGRG